MQVGDLVIFKDQGSYAKWFFGALGTVESCGRGKGTHCRVRWLTPIKYFESHATVSDFPVNFFEVYR